MVQCPIAVGDTGTGACYVLGVALRHLARIRRAPGYVLGVALRHLARIRRAPGYVLGVALRHLARIRPAISLSSHPELLPLPYDAMCSQISFFYRFVLSFSLWHVISICGDWL